MEQYDKRDRKCACCATKHTDKHTPLTCQHTVHTHARLRVCAQSKPGTTPVMLMTQHRNWVSMHAHKAVIPVILRPGSPTISRRTGRWRQCSVGASADAEETWPRRHRVGPWGMA